MKRKWLIALAIIILLSLVIAAFVSAFWYRNTKKSDAGYKVTRVVDGDTFKVEIGNTENTVRLIGIDTPETVDPRKPVQCFGVEASNEAKKILTGENVTLAGDPTQSDRDKYGRLLRYAYLPDGRLFNQLMIQEGYAYEYTYDVPYQFQADFKAAEASAKQNHLGLWADTTCGGKPTAAASSTTPKLPPPSPAPIPFPPPAPIEN